MTSRKRSARQREQRAFRSQLDGVHTSMDDLFDAEQDRRNELTEEREEAHRQRACESKNRYATRTDAEEARTWCEARGTHGLAIYRCEFCRGWHLTSHPWE